MTDFQSQLIKTAAGLLRYSPSTYRADYPRVPGYYRKAVAKYHDRARRAAILLRKASDRLRDLEKKHADLQKQMDGIELAYYQDQIPVPSPDLEDEDIPF